MHMTETETRVRISGINAAHPPTRLSQADAARAIGAWSRNPRRVAALARGTQIEQRAIALTPDEVRALGAAGARNDIYQRIAPGIAIDAARGVLREVDVSGIACLVTSSCTGYSVPTWGVDVVEAFRLPARAIRLPITESGCAGGVVALARAVDHLRTRPGASGLAVAVELCSLAFHPGGDDGNLTSTLIFGDGAGAALLETGEGPGLEVVDTASRLVPNTKHALGFALTDQGLYPILTRELPELLGEPTREAVVEFLCQNGITTRDIGAWLLHPGGARILKTLEEGLDLDRCQTHWSWDSMRDFGNTSSAAIFDVMGRYFRDRRPGEYAVVAAFGPGLSIELMLLRAQ
jgi:alkylresorcinol/alkylpyrone synthase